jgi:hypothetical protein
VDDGFPCFGFLCIIQTANASGFIKDFMKMGRKVSHGVLFFCLVLIFVFPRAYGGDYPDTPDWVKQALHPANGPAANQQNNTVPQQPDTGPETKYWPKSPDWVKDTLHLKKKQKAEPSQALPNPGQPYYLMICQEREHLYWFNNTGDIYRLTTQGVFRAPRAVCPGPRGGVLVMDLPRLAADATILWLVSDQGQTSVVNQWQPAEDLMIKRPTQIAWIGNQLYISDTQSGLLVFSQDGQLRRLIHPGNIAVEGGKPMSWAKGRFGGIVGSNDGLYVAQGTYHKTPMKSSSPISFQTTTAPGCVMRLGFGGNVSVIGNDAGGALFTPKALVIDGRGRLFVTDNGNKKHEYAGLKMLVQGQLTDVPVQVGNRKLRGPWGIAPDRDGGLLVADPIMWDSQGNSGIVLRVIPGDQSRIIFAGKGLYQPIGVLVGR